MAKAQTSNNSKATTGARAPQPAGGGAAAEDMTKQVAAFAGGGPAAASVPEHLRKYMGKQVGLEDMDASDMVIPRLSLAQDLTPQAKKRDPKYVEGLESGMFFNNVSGEIYGERVRFIPLFANKFRIKFKEPIGSGLECQSVRASDGSMFGRLSPAVDGGCVACPHSRFEDDKAPACTDFKGWVVAMPDGQPAGLSLKSTSLKVAKQMNTQIRMSSLPGFARVWEATRVEETKNNNTYWQWVLRPVEFTPAPLLARLEAMVAGLRAKNIVVETGDEPRGREDDM